MLAHSTLTRLAAAKTSARDLPQLARFVQRTLIARNACSLPVARALSRALSSAIEARRGYATTTATTPTATVKKAVKAKAASKKAPATKAAAAKKPARKTAAAKAKPKAKTKAKKTAPKKAAPKKKVKKVLTPEQQEKAKMTRLRVVALKEPVGRGAVSAYNVYIAENLKGTKDVAQGLPAISKRFNELTASEREHYNHLARERTAAKQAEYDAWIRSFTPEQINAANNARLQLRRIQGDKASRRPTGHTAKLIDERQPKKALTPYVLFNKERYASGDLKGISIQEAANVVAKEWKALSAAEKQKYEDAYAASKRELATAS